VMFLVLDFARLGTRSEACNIFVLKCISCIEPNRVMIVTPMPIAKLRFGLGIMP